MPIPKLTLVNRTRRTRLDDERRETLEHLHAHFTAVQNLIRALENYQRLEPPRGIALGATGKIRNISAQCL